MLKINVNDYEDETLTTGSYGLKFRSFKDIVYVEKPVADIQKLNIFVPLAYFHGGTVNGYNAETAPIFMPNTVGGYMPGPRDYPGNTSQPNSNGTIVTALEHGYVVVSAGLRGRTIMNHGKYIGKAPAFIVDMKAAIRFIRHNAELLPGNIDRIVTNGTSAGGATSALTGISGNESFFNKYLEELGAADESDVIFAASCYCPIHNLEHADSAYEWQFNGFNDWSKLNYATGKIETGQLDSEQVELSKDLKQQFIDYLNNLKLLDDDGQKLNLDSDGQGSFLNYVKNFIIQSAQKALDSNQTVDSDSGVIVENEVVKDIDWSKCLKFITRMKSTPAFDDLKMENAEPNLFGTENVDNQHFTKLAQEYSRVPSTLADQKLVQAINPLHYLDNKDGAKYWRIRHGASDRDTSFAIPIILATSLKNAGYKVDFAMPWNTPHSGDYDLRDLFTWIDKICAQ
ncbi:subtype B tannase [Companilactobacillus farciminis]|uniref:subtype B tannase n=1 Tax=Companilactobacillus farciminis TaxID=1612 RepID=UPI00241C06F5|nr:subtype B tannase [Companilactobacillus farciminis]